MSNYIILAAKPYKENRLVGCDLKDPEACNFTIRFTPVGCNFASELEFDNLRQAETVLHALDSAVEKGKKQAFAELRRLIGAS